MGSIMVESALFSSEDIFPGVVGSRMPYKPLQIQTKVNISAKKSLYLYRLSISLHGVKEEQIVKRLVQRAFVRFNVKPRRNYEVDVSQRKLNIFAQNTWKSLSKPQQMNV